MTKVISRFTFRDGTGTCVEVDKQDLEKLRKAKAKHVFFTLAGVPFEFKEMIEGTMPHFKEADVFEVKIGKFLKNLTKLGYLKLATNLMDHSNVPVEEFVKNIGVSPSSPKIEKIRQIKSKKNLYPIDKSYIKVLWWEAKREAFEEKIRKHNVTVHPEKRAGQKILEIKKYLDDRVTEALRDYSKFSEEAKKEKLV